MSNDAPIYFDTCLAERAEDGDVLLAFFEGSHGKFEMHRCVALLTCRKPAARALHEAVGSVLKDVE